MKTEEETEKELEQFKAKESAKQTNNEAKDTDMVDNKPVVDWHKDSYPFVCVLMLSDASKMIGGETALQTASGQVLKVRGPQMVSCVVSSCLAGDSWHTD